MDQVNDKLTAQDPIQPLVARESLPAGFRVDRKNSEQILTDKIRDSGLGAAYDNLQQMNTADLTTLLLHVLEARAGKHNVKDLLMRYERAKFCSPSSVDARALHELEVFMNNALPSSVKLVELSPVAPLAAISSLSPISQRTILATIRPVEVLSDVTTSLALEMALARKVQIASKIPAKAKTDICLAAHARPLRLQAFDPNSGFTPHFKVFGMVSGRRDQNLSTFAAESLASHLSFYTAVLESLRTTHLAPRGYQVEVAVSDIMITEKLIDRLGLPRDQLTERTSDRVFSLADQFNIPIPKHCEHPNEIPAKVAQECALRNNIEGLVDTHNNVISDLRSRYPNMRFTYDMERIAGLGYYCGPCFKIYLVRANSERIPLVDGGVTDWNGKLLSDKCERTFISGIGSELLAKICSSRTAVEN